MFQYNIGNTLIKDFYFDNEQLLMPAGTKMVHDGRVWGLYVNYEYDVSFIVTRGLLDGRYGWRIRVIPGIMSHSYAEGYVKQRCGECLGLRG
jgi:hypothetical protein